MAFALEGCTGWRYVVEELVRAGVTAHVAEPAETAALRGKKSRAKTDRADARHLRQLLVDGRVPESWIPPAHVLDARVLVRLYKDLVDERTGWLQRVHATLFHHGVPAVGASLVTAAGRDQLASACLPPAGRYAVDAGMRQVERLTAEMLPLRRQIVAVGAHQPGCRALQQHYGIGPLLAVAIWEELGDCHRFTSSDDAVRHAGLDVTVWSSDGKRTRGHLAKQGPPVLRWALYEAAVYAARPTSPGPRLLPAAASTPRGPHRLDHHRPQARPPLLPHAAQHRRRRLRRRGLTRHPSNRRPRRRPPVDDLRPAPRNPVAASPAGQPTKNERPHHVRRDTPNAILQPTPSTDAERRDKQGRPQPSEPTLPTKGVPSRRATRT